MAIVLVIQPKRVVLSRTGIQGPAGPQGNPGTTGLNGKSILYGTSAPTSGQGSDGDFFLNITTIMLYGPKASGAWPAGVSLIGAAGSNGTNGTNGSNGVDGKTVRNGSGAPSSGLGVDGDFYYDPTAKLMYGPKASGAWPVGVSLIGPAGPATLVASTVIDTPSAKTYCLMPWSPIAVTINSISGLRVASGSCTLSIQVNGVSVPGLSAIAVTTTPQSINASTPTSVPVSGEITAVVSGVSGGTTDLKFVLGIT